MDFVYLYNYSLLGQSILQILCLITFIITLYLYRYNKLALLLTLYCFPRVFEFGGSTIYNLYKISLLILCTIYFFYSKPTFCKRDKLYGGLFVLFSLYFFTTTLLFTEDTLSIIFSQWSRFAQIVMLFFILREVPKKEDLLKFFLLIFLIQIGLSIVKCCIFEEHLIEGLVGSFTIIGGAMGTILPILGFIALWCYRHGELKYYDVFYILGLLLIGYTSYKRAIILVLPLLILVMVFFTHKHTWTFRSGGIILLVIGMLYVGVRLMPSLNPERKVWGSFNLPYTLELVDTYQFGTGDSFGGTIYDTYGRGGATIGLFQLLVHPQEWTDNDMFGYSLLEMYSTDDESFADIPATLSIDKKGSATGFVQTYISLGLWGCIITLVLVFFPLFYCPNNRLRWTLILLVAWEYFFYTGLFIRTPLCMAIIFLTMFYNEPLRNNPRIQYSFHH